MSKTEKEQIFFKFYDLLKRYDPTEKRFYLKFNELAESYGIVLLDIEELIEEVDRS